VNIKPAAYAPVLAARATRQFEERKERQFEAEQRERVWALPFATLVILIAMATFDPIYLEAAWMCGANRLQAFVDVELPLIRPGVLGAATFSLILSFNETIRTAAVQGGQNTVQTYIWSTYKQVGLSPTLYALMSLLIVLTLTLVAAFLIVGARERSGQG
jgi:ABC-type spermidine/putrescine transport system permease subunit II